MQNAVNIVSVSRVRDSKQKPRKAGLLEAGATRYRRWLALGPFGGAAPIIETKNEGLMPWFRGTFSLLVRCGFRVTVSGGLWRYRSLAGWPLLFTGVKSGDHGNPLS